MSTTASLDHFFGIKAFQWEAIHAPVGKNNTQGVFLARPMFLVNEATESLMKP